jgi:hypothetical protein
VIGGADRQFKQMLARRQLANRVVYDLLPSASFDPSPEDVARFAHQLARTRPAVAWLRPRRGASVRIRLHTDAEGRLSYQVSGPASAGSVLRHQSYAQVELREALPDPDGRAGGQAALEEKSPGRADIPGSETGLGAALGTAGAAASAGEGADQGRDTRPVLREEPHVARAELVLAADAARSLRAVPLRPDLLQSFAAAVLDVRPGLGERVEVCLDMVPLTAAKAARLRKARLRQVQGGTGGGLVGGPAAGLAGEGAGLLRELGREVLPRGRALGERRARGSAGGTRASDRAAGRRDRVPAARWLLAPGSSWVLWRHMVLWQVTSYRAALDTEKRRRRAVYQLRHQYGPQWARNVPDDVAWMLNDGVLMEEALEQVSVLIGADSRQSPALRRRPLSDEELAADMCLRWPDTRPSRESVRMAYRIGSSRARRLLGRWVPEQRS